MGAEILIFQHERILKMQVSVGGLSIDYRTKQ